MAWTHPLIFRPLFAKSGNCDDTLANVSSVNIQGLLCAKIGQTVNIDYYIIFTSLNKVTFYGSFAEVHYFLRRTHSSRSKLRSPPRFDEQGIWPGYDSLPSTMSCNMSLEGINFLQRFCQISLFTLSNFLSDLSGVSSVRLLRFQSFSSLIFIPSRTFKVIFDCLFVILLWH